MTNYKNPMPGAALMIKKFLGLTDVAKRGLPLLALGATFALAGCDALDELLSVDAPSLVAASDLDDPLAANLLVASVANEFRCMATHYAAASAVTGNETGEATGTTTITIWDTRIHDTSGYGAQYASADCGSGQPALYLPLSRTRWLADQVLTSLQGWSDADVSDRQAKIAEVALYSGYSYLFFGESFCENEIAFDGGPRQSRDATWSRAIAQFDIAITSGTGDIQNAARVGRGRALLSQGMYADAAAAVAAVPAGFSWSTEYSNADSDTRNKIAEMNQRDNEITIEAPYRSVMDMGVADPRVSVTDAGFNGVGSNIPVFLADKYPDVEASIEIASWEEAQLIIAEDHARAGGARLAQFDAIINTLHGNTGVIPATYAAADQAAAMDHLIAERASENFLETQHLRDLQRFSIPLFPAVGEDHPFGAFYGDEICFDLPAVEFLNNSNSG